MKYEDHYRKAVNHFRSLLHVEMRPAEVEITPNEENPFDFHLYVSYVFNPRVSMAEYLQPAIESIARFINELKMIEVGTPKVGSIAEQKVFSCNGLKVRFTESFNAVKWQEQITLDVFVRHVGNYYRTVLHGPLHRKEMPFYTEPGEGSTFVYHYLPPTHYDYWQEDGTRLPGLEGILTEPNHYHEYQIKSGYCLYLGERLY